MDLYDIEERYFEPRVDQLFGLIGRMQRQMDAG